VALPNPLTFPIQITAIEQTGIDSSGTFTFVYHWIRTTPPANTSASGVFTVRTLNSDDYPVGQNLTLSLTLLP